MGHATVTDRFPEHQPFFAFASGLRFHDVLFRATGNPKIRTLGGASWNFLNAVAVLFEKAFGVQL
jgi:DNA-binding FadR family transcriptional regulator